MSQAREAKYRDQSLCHSGERVIAVIVVAITRHCMISCCGELAVVMSLLFCLGLLLYHTKIITHY